MKNPFLVLLTALLWTWAPLMALDVRPFLRGRPPTVSSFTAQTASFNGSSQYIRNSTTLVGVADSNDFTFSCWVDFSGGDGVAQNIFVISQAGNTKLSILKGTDNLIRAVGATPGATTVLDFKGSTAITAASTGFDGSDGWNHIFIVADISSAVQATREAACKIYINGVQETEAFTTTTSGTAMDFSVASDPRTMTGANAGLTINLNASVAELVFYDTYHDIPSSFYDGTKPADIGLTAATPTGSPADVYMSLNGSGNSWATDSSGNANTATVTGGPLGSPTAP